MNRDQFEREKNYQASVYIVQRMMAEGVIDEMECQQMRHLLRKKYNPAIGGLEG